MAHQDVSIEGVDTLRAVRARAVMLLGEEAFADRGVNYMGEYEVPIPPCIGISNRFGVSFHPDIQNLGCKYAFN